MKRATTRADRAAKPGPERFVARIYCVWIIRYVDLPPRAARPFQGRHIPVLTTCNGVGFRGTLLPRGAGQFRLAVNATVRRAAGDVDAGDEVLVTVRPTRPPRRPALPADLLSALGTRAGSRVGFESWPAGRQREVLRWLTAARRPETRAKRIRVILERLGYGSAP